VLRRLRNCDIPVIVLKGAFLAEAVYIDPALRSSMADVDIMVPRQELPRVQATLLDMGYAPREREDIELRCRTTKGLAPFTRSGFTVEPHWHIVHPTSPFRVDTAGLWARARPATIAGVEVLALSPEDLLLHLCLHTVQKHSLGLGLLPFCDIAETVRHYGPGADNGPTTETTERVGGASQTAECRCQKSKCPEGGNLREPDDPGTAAADRNTVSESTLLHPSLRELCGSTSDSGRGGELDWSRFTDRAREWGAARYVGLALDLTRSLLGAEVPGAVLEQLVPGGIDSRTLETARESVLARTGYGQSVPFFDEFGARSFPDKARVSWERIFLSREQMASRYPDSRTSHHLYPYYALRVRDVARAFGAYVLRRARLLMQTRGREPAAALVKWLNGD
jgi:hypothetical protein